MRQHVVYSDFLGSDVLDRTGRRIGYLKDILVHEIGFRIESLVIHMPRLLRSRDVLVSPQAIQHRTGTAIRFDLDRRDLWHYPRRKDFEYSDWIPPSESLEPPAASSSGSLTPLGPWGTYLGPPSWYPEFPETQGSEVDDVIVHHRRYRPPSGRLMSLRQLMGFVISLQDEKVGFVSDALIEAENWGLTYILFRKPGDDINCVTPLPTRFVSYINLLDFAMRFEVAPSALDRCPTLLSKFDDFDEQALWYTLSGSRIPLGA